MPIFFNEITFWGQFGFAFIADHNFYFIKHWTHSVFGK